MTQEPVGPDLVALTRALGAAESVDDTMAFFASGAVWDRQERE
jgi:hypothetical protein